MTTPRFLVAKFARWQDALRYFRYCGDTFDLSIKELKADIYKHIIESNEDKYVFSGKSYRWAIKCDVEDHESLVFSIFSMCNK